MYFLNSYLGSIFFISFVIIYFICQTYFLHSSPLVSLKYSRLNPSRSKWLSTSPRFCFDARPQHHSKFDGVFLTLKPQGKQKISRSNHHLLFLLTLKAGKSSLNWSPPQDNFSFHVWIFLDNLRVSYYNQEHTTRSIQKFKIKNFRLPLLLWFVWSPRNFYLHAKSTQPFYLKTGEDSLLSSL